MPEIHPAIPTWFLCFTDFEQTAQNRAHDALGTQGDDFHGDSSHRGDWLPLLMCYGYDFFKKRDQSCVVVVERTVLQYRLQCFFENGVLFSFGFAALPPHRAVYLMLKRLQRRRRRCVQ